MFKVKHVIGNDYYPPYIPGIRMITFYMCGNQHSTLTDKLYVDPWPSDARPCTKCLDAVKRKEAAKST